MAAPLIIDTDMGIDDAVAVGLALSNAALDVRAVIGVGGRGGVGKVATNIGRVLTAFSPARMPVIAQGREPSAAVQMGGVVPTGKDGLGDCPSPMDKPRSSRISLRCIADASNKQGTVQQFWRLAR